MMPATAVKSSINTPAFRSEDKRTSVAKISLSLPKSMESSIYEVLLSAAQPDKTLCIPIDGGSDAGKFCLIGSDINPSRLVYHPILSAPKKSASILRPGDVILEIGDYQVSGYTRQDAIKLCETLSYSEEPVNHPRVLLKLIPVSALPSKDVSLRSFLSNSFNSDSSEFVLREVTRDNIYQRVVPCTTRHPKPDEVHGVHYQFLNVEEFLALEKSGHLLESGTYNGNFYGTPRPDPSASALDPQLLARRSAAAALVTQSSSTNVVTSITPPGNSSTGTEMLSCSRRGEPVPFPPTRQSSVNTRSTTAVTTSGITTHADMIPNVTAVPLTSQWNTAFSGLAQPRISSMSAPGCPTSNANTSDQIKLPRGWDVINHPEYGTFYIDHVHKKTQYEPPTVADFEEAATAVVNLDAVFTPDASSLPSPVTVLQTPSIRSGLSSASVASSASSSLQCRYPPDVFTTDISQLRGPLANCCLVKGPRGFGFSIIGGSSPTQPGFLQITNLIPSGAAAGSGILCVGDVLVSVNGVNVLGYSHDEIVSLFQSVPIDSSVSLVVSQGYCLSVSSRDIAKKSTQISASKNRSCVTADSFSNTNGGIPCSLPELCLRNLNTSPTFSQTSNELHHGHASNQRLEFIKVSIVKHENGYGFTLADQLHGQRVKEILDPSRCDSLKVDDVVVEINDQRVKEMTHLEVVCILKSCPVGVPTRFLVQRGQSTNPDLNPHNVVIGSAFMNLPECSSFDNLEPIVQPVTIPGLLNGSYPVPNADRNLLLASAGAAGGRFRSRTPGADDGRSFRSSAFCSSSDCIYSLSGSISGLDLASSQLHHRLQPGQLYDGDYLNMQTASNGGYGYGSLLRSRKMPPLQSQHLNSAAITASNNRMEGLFFDEFLVRLQPHDNSFGFKLVGGAEEGTQLVIGSLTPGGSAQRSGLIRTGDRLISINSTRVVGAKHHKVVELLDQASASHYHVTLGLHRPSTLESIISPSFKPRSWSDDGVTPPDHPPPPRLKNVILHRTPGEDGFGFLISNSFPKHNSVGGKFDGSYSKLQPPYVALLVPGKPAKRSRQLHIGDYLLAVNGESIVGRSQDNIARLIRESGNQVTLTILPQSHAGTIDTFQSQCWFPTASQASILSEIVLLRTHRSFGFSIRGGHEFNQMPLTVLRVAEGGAAHLDGRLRVGDELIQINGHFTKGMSHQRAVQIIQAGHDMIRLVVRRPFAAHFCGPDNPVHPTNMPVLPSVAVNCAQKTASSWPTNQGYSFDLTSRDLPPGWPSQLLRSNFASNARFRRSLRILRSSGETMFYAGEDTTSGDFSDSYSATNSFSSADLIEEDISDGLAVYTPFYIRL